MAYQYRMTPEEIAKTKAEIAAMTRIVWVINTPSGQAVATLSKNVAKRYKGTIAQAEIRTLDLVRSPGVKLGRAQGYLVADLAALREKS